MRNILCILLTVLLLSGCSDRADPNVPQFYYPRVEYHYDGEDQVMTTENREDLQGLSAYKMINAYLQGPVTEGLSNPFPPGLELVSLHTVNANVHIVVTDHMANLSGASLILACTCLGRTALALTGTDSATVRCVNLLLDGKASLTINAETVLLTDQLPTENTSSE